MVILATAGQRHEALMLRRLMEAGAVKRPGRGRPRLRPDALAGDKGYSYPSLRRYLRRRGIRAVIPPSPTSPVIKASTRPPTGNATRWSHDRPAQELATGRHPL
jgi:hypothetical protein